MTKLTNEERLMKLETQLETVLREIRDMRNDVKTMNSNYVSEKKHENDLVDLEEKIKKVDKRRWFQNTLSAILGSVLALLVAFFINNVSL